MEGGSRRDVSNERVCDKAMGRGIQQGRRGMGESMMENCGGRVFQGEASSDMQDQVHLHLADDTDMAISASALQ